LGDSGTGLAEGMASGYKKEETILPLKWSAKTVKEGKARQYITEIEKDPKMSGKENETSE